jgi:hypothetical protein
MANPQTQTTICLPGENAWELWRQSPGGMTLAQSLALEEGSGPSAFKGVTVFGYPVISAFSVPVWASSGDQEIIDGVVSMQLEKLNLMPDNAVGQLVDTRIIERMESKTLVTSTVISEAVLPELPATAPESFEVTPDLFYLPDNSLILWKELGRLIVCATRGEHPVYFHALTESELSSSAVSEIESMLMPLYMQEILPDLDGIVIWTEAVAPGADQELANTLRLPLRHEKKPAPAQPKTRSNYEPVSVALGKIRAARRKRIRNIAALAVGAYLLVVTAFIGMHFWDSYQNDELERKTKPLMLQSAFVEPTMRQWEMTEPLRNKDLFPIETIRRVLDPIAGRQFSGVRITSVRLDGNNVEIKGEGQAQNTIINYRNYLVGNGDTNSFDWPQPQWGAQRAGLFTFTISGKRKDSLNES